MPSCMENYAISRREIDEKYLIYSTTKCRPLRENTWNLAFPWSAFLVQKSGISNMNVPIYDYVSGRFTFFIK